MSQRYIGGLIYNPPGGYSGYFDGSGDYLTTPANSAFTLGTGDYTLELWVFLTAVSREHTLFDFRANASASGSHYITTSDKIGIWNGSSLVGGTGSSVPANTWSHIAYVRSSGSVTAYLNGVAQWTASYADNLTNNVAYVCGSFNGLSTLQGYASNARIVKGTAVYTTAFTPPNGPLQNITNTSLLTCRYPTFVDGSSNAFTITVNGNTTVSTQNPFPLTTLPNPAQGGAGNGIFSMSQYQSLKQQNLWPAIDPYFEYTTLLLHGNGTNGGQNNTFLDSSTNNFTITRNGNTTQGTFSPFSQTGWSNYFDGSGDYLQAGTSSNLALGSGDFTVEGWHFCTGYNGGGALYSTINTYPSSTGFLFYIYSDGSYTIDVNGTILKTTAVAALNTWVHYAVVRSGSTITIYANGTSVGTVSNSTNFTDQYAVIGRTGAGSASNYYLGYLSNCRTVKGTAVYTSAFTPPTAPLTAITNTQFLTCQSNRFIDNSANQFTITVNGNTSVQAFSPFAPTAAYSASTVGGSGYFDGSGDYLSIPSNTAFAFGTGDFTVEGWIYYASVASNSIRILATAGAAADCLVEVSTSSELRFYDGSTTTTFTGITTQANAWNHIAVTRSGTSLRGYINGSQVGSTVTNSANIANTQAINFPATTNYAAAACYISNVRYLKGTALYTGSTYTIPTAPLTNITNTSLLCNFTNAAIIDNTAKNVLETVGNAQISTTQSKFGGASMYFDGTGDWLTSPATVNTSFGTGNFTVECWIYSTVNQNNNLIVSNRVTAVDTAWSLEFYNNGTGNNILNWHSGTTVIMYASTAANTSTWNHVAVVRSGTTTKIYLNGTEVASATDSRNYSYVGPVQVGYEALAGTSAIGYYNGYIDDLRITKGIARYTSNFTPQTSQWQDQ